MRTEEIKDGIDDCCVKLDGVTILVIPDEAVKKIGYENSKLIISIFAAQIKLTLEALGIKFLNN